MSSCLEAGIPSKPGYVGVKGFSTYVPFSFIDRARIADANAWYEGSLRSIARGRRSFACWDEDSITMAVELGRRCLESCSGSEISSLYLASITFPFAERFHAQVVAEALSLGNDLRLLDVASSERCGTQALLAALESNSGNDALVIATHNSSALSGSRLELLSGDGGVALQVGCDNVIAHLVAGETRNADFFARYRAHGLPAYDWEDRWCRDEGRRKLATGTIKSLLQRAGVAPRDLAKVVLPFETSRANIDIARSLDIAPESVVGEVLDEVGHCGPAQPLLLFASCLESAEPEDLILLVSFSQGCDSLLFRCTNLIAAHQPNVTLSAQYADRRAEENYTRFTSMSDQHHRDLGKRSEVDRQLQLTTYYRNRKFLTSFIGVRCSTCDTQQIPPAPYCVNPSCSKELEGDEVAFSSLLGTVASWTADHLTFDPSPPAHYGMVDFEGGGRLLMDFADVGDEPPAIGDRVRMQFRIRSIDGSRGGRKYFWKASLRKSLLQSEGAPG